MFPQDSSSVVEWTQCPDRSQQLLETQQSYETEWDMVNAVSFRKKPCTNGEGEVPESSSCYFYLQQVAYLLCLCFLVPASCLSGSLNQSHERSRWALTFSVCDIRSITVKEEGWTFLIFKLKEASTCLPALHFHQGGSREFLESLRRFALLTE